MKNANHERIHAECHRAGIAEAERASDTGLCGFAWIELSGRISFAQWAKHALKAHPGYPSGVHIWVRDFGQSHAKKEAYASGYASALRRFGIVARPNSRLD